MIYHLFTRIDLTSSCCFRSDASRCSQMLSLLRSSLLLCSSRQRCHIRGDIDLLITMATVKLLLLFKSDLTLLFLCFQAQIAFLQGERKGQENLKKDLVRRIKMLEYALKQERWVLTLPPIIQSAHLQLAEISTNLH